MNPDTKAAHRRRTPERSREEQGRLNVRQVLECGVCAPLWYRHAERASVLVGVLWCVSILSVVVIGSLYSTRLHLGAAKNFEDKVQAHYLAIAAIEKAKALIYHETVSRRKAGIPDGHPFEFSELNRDEDFGRGRFRVIRPGEDGKADYGFRDEESRLNVNTATADELVKLRGMEREMASAIIDWRDKDSAPQPGGAEGEYYAASRPAYLPRNDAIQTIREMLLIRGIPEELLLGEDRNQNGLLDPEENDGDATPPRDNRDNVLDAGWSQYFTVNSAVENLRANGEKRVNIQTAQETDLTGLGIDQKIARAIVAYNGKKKIENLADLLDVAELAPDRPNPARPGQPNQPQANQTQGVQTVGPKLIDAQMLQSFCDDIKVNDQSRINGAVNINTAPWQALACLPGVSEDLAQQIVNQRQALGYFPNVAAILQVTGMTTEIFRQISPRISARSETFHIIGEGKVSSTGARVRVEAIIRVGDSTVLTLSYRENL